MQDLSLIALAGYGQTEDRQRAIDAGFNAYLVKPLKFDELDEAVRRAPALRRDTNPAALARD